METPPYIEYKGYWWPKDTPEHTMQHSLNHMHDMEFAVNQCKAKKIAVQAGGCIGLWAKQLAKSFEKVFTFEPHDVLYGCCRKNITERNVVISKHALGEINTFCSLLTKGLGSHRVERSDGDIRMCYIDELVLPALDFLCLDVEGYEINILQGGEKSIKKYKPIIQVEDRGFHQKYGYAEADLHSFLGTLNYQRIGKVGADNIYAYIG